MIQVGSGAPRPWVTGEFLHALGLHLPQSPTTAVTRDHKRLETQTLVWGVGSDVGLTALKPKCGRGWFLLEAPEEHPLPCLF